jgi:hypothetical protein
MWATFVNFKNPSILNNHPMGENSPNLATPLGDIFTNSSGHTGCGFLLQSSDLGYGGSDRRCEASLANSGKMDYNCENSTTLFCTCSDICTYIRTKIAVVYTKNKIKM